MVLQAIKYQRGKLEILDQLLLPHHEIYLHIQSPQEAWSAIQHMQVRGAPAIAIVAALSLAVFLTNHNDDQRYIISPHFISHNLKYLVTSRPTAVNLADAARKLEKVVYAANTLPDSTNNTVSEAYVKAAEQMLVDDRQDNENIGRFGADWILHHQSPLSANGKVAVLTHCNTGSLATAGYGTALGVIRSLHARNSLSEAFYTETRPYNQGSRLTGYELLHDQIPCRLITDSMAGALLIQREDRQNVSCVVVGADRVTANGDTANKIGTYSLAILARHHGVKFLVAAPRTTIDLNTASGQDIIIEERSPWEVIIQKGPSVKRPADLGYPPAKGLLVDSADTREILIAHSWTKAWNPAFDVTPAELIDGIVTEKGVVEKGADGRFHFESIFDSDGTAGHPGIEDIAEKPQRLESRPVHIPEGLMSWKSALSTDATDVPEWSAWLKGVTTKDVTKEE